MFNIHLVRFSLIFIDTGSLLCRYHLLQDQGHFYRPWVSCIECGKRGNGERPVIGKYGVVCGEGLDTGLPFVFFLANYFILVINVKCFSYFSDLWSVELSALLLLFLFG